MACDDNFLSQLEVFSIDFSQDWSPEDTPDTDGPDLKRLRKALDMYQEEFGDLVGVTQKTISQWERGQKSMRAVYPKQIIRTLHELMTFARENLSEEKFEKRMDHFQEFAKDHPVKIRHLLLAVSDRFEEGTALASYLDQEFIDFLLDFATKDTDSVTPAGILLKYQATE